MAFVFHMIDAIHVKGVSILLQSMCTRSPEAFARGGPRVCFVWWEEPLLVISFRQSTISGGLTRLKNGHVTRRRTRPCSTHGHLLTLSATGRPLPPPMEFRARWSGAGVPCQCHPAWVDVSFNRNHQLEQTFIMRHMVGKVGQP